MSVENQLNLIVRIYFLILNSILLVYICIPMLVPQSLLWNVKWCIILLYIWQITVIFQHMYAMYNDQIMVIGLPPQTIIISLYWEHSLLFWNTQLIVVSIVTVWFCKTFEVFASIQLYCHIVNHCLCIPHDLKLCYPLYCFLPLQILLCSFHTCLSFSA